MKKITCISFVALALFSVFTSANPASAFWFKKKCCCVNPCCEMKEEAPVYTPPVQETKPTEPVVMEEPKELVIPQDAGFTQPEPKTQNFYPALW
jgi:hypothetical protein